MKSQNPKIDEITKKLLQKSVTIEPSGDFTDKIMARLETEAELNVNTYTEVLSKKTKIIVIISFIVLIVFILLKSTPTENGYLTKAFEKVDFNRFSETINNFVSNMFGIIEISPIILISCIVIVLFWILDHSFRKTHLFR